MILVNPGSPQPIEKSVQIYITMEDVSKPLTLKCGLTLPNRLVKAALAENMADSRNLPHAQFYRAYSKWADGGWGMIFTGTFSLMMKR